jgi:hypothetical protein
MGAKGSFPLFFLPRFFSCTWEHLNAFNDISITYKNIYISYIMVINYLAYISIFINYFIRCKSCFNKKICEMRNMLQTWERLNAFNDISTTYKIYISWLSII